MSQYQGSNLKVRCVDCVKLSGEICTAKKSNVAPKKRRICPSYQFRGEFNNRQPLQSIYLPPVDKETMKMLKKLMKMGIMPTADSGNLRVTPDGQVLHSQKFDMPKSTATASVVGMKSNEDALLSNPNKLANSEEETAIWSPDAGTQEEEHEDCQSDNDRS